MKRIAIVYYSNYSSWPMGGIVNYLRNILPFLEKEYVMDLWGCSVDGVLPDVFTLEGNSYNIKAFGNAKTKNKLIPNNIRSMFEMIGASKRINSIQYDYIYFHSTNLLYSYKKKGRNADAKIILHLHGLGIPPTRAKKVLEYIQLKAVEKADIVLINSDKQSIKEYVETCFPDKVGKFYQAISPVNLDIFKPVSPDEKKRIKEKYGLGKGKLFVYTGRITQQKDPLFVLEAFSVLHEKDNKCKLLYIGSGDLENKVRNRILDLELKNYCIMLGKKSQQELIELLSVCDVFVIASMGEGTSLSIAEALACGVPVVAVDAVGVREFVEDGINGELVLQRDVQMFAKSMYRVAFSNYSDNARKSIERAAVNKVSKSILDAIQQR